MHLGNESKLVLSLVSMKLENYWYFLICVIKDSKPVIVFPGQAIVHAQLPKMRYMKIKTVYSLFLYWLPSQSPLVKKHTITIADVTNSLRSEVPTKEVPIVHTETKTITYESAQVREYLLLANCFEDCSVNSFRCYFCISGLCNAWLEKACVCSFLLAWCSGRKGRDAA